MSDEEFAARYAREPGATPLGADGRPTELPPR